MSSNGPEERNRMGAGGGGGSGAGFKAGEACCNVDNKFVLGKGALGSGRFGRLRRNANGSAGRDAFRRRGKRGTLGG